MIGHPTIDGTSGEIRDAEVEHKVAENKASDSVTSEKELSPEYEMLRREILQNQVMSLQIIAGTVTLAGLALGFAVGSSSQHVDPLAQLVFAAAAGWIVFIGTTLAIEKENASLTIAAYMRQFIERCHPNTVLWETRLAEFRKVPEACPRLIEKYQNFFVDLCELGYTRLQSLMNYALLALLSFFAAGYKLFQFWPPPHGLRISWTGLFTGFSYCSYSCPSY
jgi:hypothetical protein